MKWRDVNEEPSAPLEAPAAIVVSQQEEEFDDTMFDFDDEGIDGELQDGTDAVQVPSATEGQYKTAISTLPDVSGLTSDELFQKAVEASYWAGYWAAAYRVSRALFVRYRSTVVDSNPYFLRQAKTVNTKEDIEG